MTSTERMLSIKNGTQGREYAALVDRKIRARYSLSDELAILRRREDEPTEFEAYHDFAELCKAEAKKEIYGEEETA